MLIEIQDLPGNAAPEAGALPPQFATPPGLDPVGIEINHGAAWRRRAAELADWVLQFVVRADCHGGHTIRQVDGRRVVGRTTRKSPLTREALEDHFAAEDTPDILGLHVTSPDEQGVLVVVDIDAHGDAGDDPEKNRTFARHVYDEARRLGFVALWLDSNGKGGSHVWVCLGRMTPMAQAWRLGKFLVRDHAEFGFIKPPESFPKSPCLTGKRFGGWVRIFGRHHKRPFWTRVWDEQRKRWVSGDAAVALILATTPVPVDVAAVLPAEFTGEPPRPERDGQAAPRRSLASRTYGYRRTVRLAEEAAWHLRGGEVDDYVAWLEVGTALRELGADGLRIWSAWSRLSKKYRKGEPHAKWQSFGPGGPGDRTMLGLGTLFHRAEAHGFNGHLASRRWAEYLSRGPGVLDDGEDPARLADEARDHKFALTCDEAVAVLEGRPDLRTALAAAWGVSAEATRLLGVGLREDRELGLERYRPTGRWAVTVPLSAGGAPDRARTVGYVRLYPGEAWKARLGWDSRPGLILPWDLEDRQGPVVVCGDPADTARALELGGRAVGLAEPAAPLDELVSFLTGDHAAGRDIVVAPSAGHWADETAYRLGQITGRPVNVLALPEGTRALADCIIDPEERQEDGNGGE